MSDNIKHSPPAFRKLKGYAFDPSLSIKIDTAMINNIIYKVKWEDDLLPGPAGEYLEIIDYDPVLKVFYKPVDLNHPYLLASDGLNPSESNPQFHQQMLYAVVMTTIKNFESALGREVLWAPRIKKLPGKIESGKYKKNDDADLLNEKNKQSYEFVKKLRIYPHAFRDANAFYSPQKKALLFGYFLSQPADITVQMPDSQIFTCLSHDIVAHETTHAILDGIYSKYIEDTNPDTLAFHEAFADIVALFQHFTFPEVLKHQIAKTKGDLSSENLLGQLAQQFGSAIGKYGALRDAIGEIDPFTNSWKPKEPNGNEYQTITEPHERGSILVSAVFDAFITIYKNRVSDLLRLASGGTGILPLGDLHPDLVNRLSTEASKSASHILKMCIRALDYCPPVDITFGDFLRAIITADSDLVSDDSKDYRIAFIDAFRKRGIYPAGIKNLSVESLCYPECNIKDETADRYVNIITKFLREFSGIIIYAKSREEIYDLTRDYVGGKKDKGKIIYGLHRRFYEKFDGSPEFEKITGLVFSRKWESLGIKTSYAYTEKGPSFEVHSLKYASRIGPSGNQDNQVIITILQKTGIEIIKSKDGTLSVKTFIPTKTIEQKPEKFVMFGGVTLIFDLNSQKLKYAISKPLIDITELNKGNHKINTERAIKLYNYFNGYNSEKSEYAAYFSNGINTSFTDPFSFLHTH